MPWRFNVSEEKVQREVAAMRFLGNSTNLRVPRVFHHGTAEESPKGIGPFIIMEYIDHGRDFIDALNIPGRPRDARPMLDPDISQERLEFVYGQMADIMLQVSKHSFAEVGCIDKANDDDTWIAKHRPLTFNMNDLTQLGGFPPNKLPQHPFKTASSYYQELAEMHMNHLISQRNDAIDSAEDCRQKSISENHP